MTPDSIQLTQFTQVRPTTVGGRIIQFPLSRILISIAFLVPISLLQMAFAKNVRLGLEGSARSLSINLEAVIGFTLFLLSYALYTRLVEKRKATEISAKGAVIETGYGLLIGGALMGALVGLLFVLGYYRLAAFNPDYLLPVKAILPALMAAFVEELLFRLILFRLTEELLGSWVAFAIQALLFGFAHGANPGATLWSSVAIVIEAGVLLAAAYMLTRRVWLVLGIHLAWNFTQSTIFGITVSGTRAEGLMMPLIKGPAWLTGGQFGIEASVPAVVLGLVAGLVILYLAVKKGRIVAPAWIRARSLPPE